MASVPADGGCASFVIGLISIYSSIFNFTAIGYAVKDLQRADADLPHWLGTGANSASLWGAVLGMFLLGAAGDWLGRARAMSLTLLLALTGSLGSAFLTFGDNTFMAFSLVLWRFVLGIGIGGVFPLSAVSVSEAKAGSADDKSRSVGLVFISMPVANVCTPLLVVLVEFLVSSPAHAWRCILACGAGPLAIVFALSLRAGESTEFLEAASRRRQAPVNGGAARAQLERTTLWTLMGTAGSWFVLDVAWYGLAVCMPTVTHIVFGIDDALQVALYNAALVSLSIPLNVLSVWLSSDRRLGRRQLQALGFVIMAVSMSLLGAALQLASDDRRLISVLYALMVLSTNSVCGLTTYVLPQECFPVEIRASMSGVSAAAGKIGGALGVILFTPILASHGLPCTMYIAAACQVLGMLVTLAFVPETRRRSFVASLGGCAAQQTLTDGVQLR
eukprot:TRINITY_DN55798_c0_g1_i1.p2 TRINITY_DN55798_c0_g1~~TRINITY_DN55798_c0_g1_i1.p2  ORF type:complete len:446 (+),score=114.37 TRINITY_DN55798_c0_g1_i1:61-1398(+)